MVLSEVKNETSVACDESEGRSPKGVISPQPIPRILFLSQTPEYGGTEKHLVEVVRRLEGRANCIIVCLAEDFYSRFLGRWPHVRVVTHARIKWAKFARFWLLFALHRPDVIVFEKGIPHLFPLSAYLAARTFGGRRLVCIENLMWDPAPALGKGTGLGAMIKRLIGWRTRFMLAKRFQGRLAHVTICVSEALRRRLTTEYGYPADRTVTIHTGADVRHFTSGTRTVADDELFTIVCVARLSHVKRIDLLLDALSMVARSQKNWRCFILGSGPKETELRAQATSLGLETCVTFVGHVDDVRPYLRMADVLVLSSENEGLPLSLAEAMAMGVPCIASDVGGTGEIVCDGQTGLLFRSGSVEELSRAITYLLIHGEERRRMGAKAKQWVHEHFDIDRLIARVSDVLLSGVHTNAKNPDSSN